MYLIYFQTSGEVTVRVQAETEGVGFDQFLYKRRSVPGDAAFRGDC